MNALLVSCRVITDVMFRRDGHVNLLASDIPTTSKSSMDSALVHLAPGSSSTQVTPSFDVQICINDVTVVDDVSVPSDTESCRSTEPVARRRRCSWCPDEADKQRHLSINGRRFVPLQSVITRLWIVLLTGSFVQIFATKLLIY